MNELIIKDNTKIEDLIYEVRGVQVMLSSDISKLYNVETKALNQTIKRNINRFPNTFCFQLSEEEIKLVRSRSQNVTLNKSSNMRGSNIKYAPYVLTEQGIMMLSGLLKSDIAVKVNVQIINAFVTMRKYISTNLLEQKYINNLVLEHDSNIKLLQESFSKFEEKKQANEIYFNGQIYDAYYKICEILNEAKNDLIIVDAYADNTILDIIKRLEVNVVIITKANNLLTNQDIEKYEEQYHNLKVIFNNTFHDRYFILDNNIIYHCGTSINRIGYKTFSLNLINDDLIKEALLERVQNITDS